VRRATADDAERLLAWRNDPQTRAMSLNDAAVTKAEHAQWLAKTLQAEDRVLLVAELDGDPIGTLRLDAHAAGRWEVSITVAPHARQKKLAAPLLRAAEAEAKTHGATLLTATIRPQNEASVRAFKTAGYYAFVERGPVLVCQRRIVPYL
jgi:RimJ/RimL family protein N-acetyltransferase